MVTAFLLTAIPAAAISLGYATAMRTGRLRGSLRAWNVEFGHGLRLWPVIVTLIGWVVVWQAAMITDQVLFEEPMARALEGIVAGTADEAFHKPFEQLTSDRAMVLRAVLPITAFSVCVFTALLVVIPAVGSFLDRTFVRRRSAADGTH